MPNPIGAPSASGTGQSYTDPSGQRWVSVKNDWYPQGYSGGGGGLLGAINKPSNFAGRWLGNNPAYAKHATMATWLAAGLAGGGAFGGGFAGGGGGAGGSAATVNPFAANAGMGASWAPIGGSAAFPTVAGAGGLPATAGIPSTAGATAGASTPWYNTFLGQTALSTGGNLLGGFLQNRAIGQAQNASNQQIQDRIRQALAQLSPEHIMALAQQFLPQMAANMNVAGQAATQAVREQAARTGQLEGPRALSFEAGTRAKLASDVQQQAFLAAINNAGAAAGAVTGAPYTPIQPQMGYADALMQSLNQAYLARALSQQPQYSPYRWPGQQWGPY